MTVPYRRRLFTLLVVLGILALPPVVLRAACLGETCTEPGEAAGRVPFCSLPSALRDRLAAGYREGRSPEVLGVPREPGLGGWEGVDDPPRVEVAWPSTEGDPRDSVPLVFSGTGVREGAEIPAGTPLSSVAPTILEIVGDRWAFPDVHEGEPIPGVASGEAPRLVLLVAVKGVGADELRAGDAELRRLAEGSGVWTRNAVVGSMPLDPAATMTTIGAGAPPDQHGIVGTYLRNDETGELSRAWGPGSPLSVIAGIGDDLDRASGERALVGMVGSDPADRGLVGGTWYPDGDRDEVDVVAPAHVPSAAARVLERGFGADATPDLLGVALEGSFAGMQPRLREIVARADRASDGSLTVVVAGTGGSSPGGTSPTTPSDVVGPVEQAVPGAAPAVEAAVPGGLFLDQTTLASSGVSSSVAVDALLAERDADGASQFADAFAGFAVQFGRYC